jgi:hypothetical protein
MTMQKNAAVNVEPIAKVIDDLAENLRHRAAELDRHAEELRATGDLDIVSVALNVAVSTANMRLDLLVTRPIRELQRAQQSPIQPE